ncbi:glycosyltransferase family 4 protein [Croceicoccus bisphenolivorans]|uniref:glycosyltransferase family 4 protein n=1 Tax=Croceicoccus bisphenolivorans TaxID=1783232 RepID=UPI000833C7C1|nr:glycosyltransferase family 1 protein [Croceicoccus bisphenolivorans]
MIILNARFTGQPMTGVQRAAYELGRRLLAMRSDIAAVAPDEPAATYDIPVRVPSDGRLRGHAWEQLALPRLAGRDDWLLGLGGTGPVAFSRQIVMIHDVNYLIGADGYSRKFRWTYRAIHTLLARRAKICTVSHWSAREIAKAYDLDPASIAVIPNAADHILSVMPDRQAPASLGITERPYVLCVGSANPNKNFGTALAAYSAIPDPSFDLVIVGGSDARIFADGGAAKAHPRIHRLPRISDEALRAVIEQAAVILMPSLLEGFGIPAIEAMALGTPVIAADASALPEVCGDAAILVDPHDPAAMTAAMTRVMDDPALRTGLIASGHAQAARYSWDRSADKLSALIDQVLSSQE